MITSCGIVIYLYVNRQQSKVITEVVIKFDAKLNGIFSKNKNYTNINLLKFSASWNQKYFIKIDKK